MKSIKKNFIYNMLYQIVYIAVPLVVTPYLTRTIGAEGIGKYAYGYSIAYYFALFIKLGLNNYGNRTIAAIREDRGKLSCEFWNMYAFQLAAMFFISALYGLYCIYIASDRMIGIFFLLSIIAAGIDITWFFWGMEEFKATVTRDLLVKFGTTVSVFLFVKNSQDTLVYIGIMCVGAVFSQLLLWPVLHRYVDFVMPTLQGITRHIRPNFVLFIPTIAVSLYKTMDIIMLGYMTDTVQVGYYHSSENIINIPLAVINALGLVMLPHMSNLMSKKASKEDITEIIHRSILFAMFCSSLFCFGIMSVSKQFVPLFFGAGFDTCIILFDILLPSCLFLAFANVIRTQYLIPMKKDKEFIISLFAGAGVNLICNTILIPDLGAIGAAVGTLAAEITVCIIQMTFVNKAIALVKYACESSIVIVPGIVMYLFFHNWDIGFDLNWISLIVKIIVCGVFYFMFLGVLLKIVMKKRKSNENDGNQRTVKRDQAI